MESTHHNFERDIVVEDVNRKYYRGRQNEISRVKIQGIHFGGAPQPATTTTSISLPFASMSEDVSSTDDRARSPPEEVDGRCFLPKSLLWTRKPHGDVGTIC